MLKSKITVETILEKKQNGEKVVSLTAYDYPSARILDESEIDIILVGDSVGMVLLGYETTVPVTLEEMLHHTKAVSRSVKKALIISDMPYKSYETEAEALLNAKRLMQEGGAEGVKLEGGSKIKNQIEALKAAGIPVMGHLGLTPQSINELGGYKVQGRDPEKAEEIYRDALLLDQLGVFALVLECVPADLAERITQAVSCVTIGIGAGSKTDGQVLVLHDMLGINAKVHPRFVRRYGSLEDQIKNAVGQYRDDVKKGKFPSGDESF